MTAARDRIVERRLHRGLHSCRRKARRISRYFEGRVHAGIASTHKLRSGRLYNLRLRIWRRFHTVPLISGNNDFPWSSLRR